MKRVMMIGLDAADPYVVKKLVKEGRLPHFKQLIENGAAHESLSMIGVLPSVTPPNWASLATGNSPRTHGVTCYYNHTLGQDLQINQVNWDSRRVQSELIWETFSKQGKRAIMLNYVEAWPPRFQDPTGIYIDGTGVIPFMRCVVDYQKVVTLKEGDFAYYENIHTVKETSNDCVIKGDQFEKMVGEQAAAKKDDFEPMVEYKGKVMLPGKIGLQNDDADELFSPLKDPEGWQVELPEGAKVATIILNNGLVRRYVVLSASDGQNYDTITIYKNKNSAPLGTAKAHAWSDIIYDEYTKKDEKVRVAYNIRVMNIAADGSKAEFYISNATNMDDLTYYYPQSVGQRILSEVGPMMPYAKFGRELEHEGAEILLESFDMLHNWHADVTDWLFKEYPDWQLYYIHLHAIDLYAHWFMQKYLPGSYDDYEFQVEMFYKLYESMDRYIGRMMEYLDDETTIFVTSDHGVTPRSVGYTNPGIGSLSGVTAKVMEDLGFTKTYTDEDGVLQIDWANTRAVFQRSSYVYINLKGREPHGIVEEADYAKTVEEVISGLYNYRDPKSGKRIVAFCMNRDEMEFVRMGGEHCGDILVQLQPDFNKEHAYCPSTTNNAGFSLNNLCFMSGSGIKKGVTLNRTIHITDIVPTICHLTDSRMPNNVEGGIIYQALTDSLGESY